MNFTNSGSVVSLESKSLDTIRQADGTIDEKALIFALLRHKPPNFIWDCRNDFIEWDSSIRNHVVLNRLQRACVYTSKVCRIVVDFLTIITDHYGSLPLLSDQPEINHKISRWTGTQNQFWFQPSTGRLFGDIETNKVGWSVRAIMYPKNVPDNLVLILLNRLSNRTARNGSHSSRLSLALRVRCRKCPIPTELQRQPRASCIFDGLPYYRGGGIVEVVRLQSGEGRGLRRYRRRTDSNKSAGIRFRAMRRIFGRYEESKYRFRDGFRDSDNGG